MMIDINSAKYSLELGYTAVAGNKYGRSVNQALGADPDTPDSWLNAVCRNSSQS